MLLLSKTQVLEAFNLSVEDVRAAMERGGYDSNDISDAEPCGMRPDGTFVYRITYPSSEDDGDETGMVYLKYARKAFSSEYYLTGDF